MVNSAAATWGINSTGFLLLYGLLCVVWGTVLWEWRRHVLAASDGARPKRALSPCELAMLNGGPELAVTAAAAQLRAAGKLQPGAKRHTLHAKGSVSHGADTLEREVFEAVKRQPGIAIKQLRHQVRTGPAIGALAAQLAGQGLLLGTGARRLVNTMWIWALPLLGLGIARLIAGTENHKPIGYLFVMVMLVIVITGWTALSRQRATSAGAQLLARERAGASNWRAAPTRASSPRVVALYGGSVLWAIDPAFASAWSVPREKAAVWLGNYGGMGGYGGGGTGCGGGGGGCGGCGG